jgi:hypothetical protein
MAAGRRGGLPRDALHFSTVLKYWGLLGAGNSILLLLLSKTVADMQGLRRTPTLEIDYDLTMVVAFAKFLTAIQPGYFRLST